MLMFKVPHEAYQALYEPDETIRGLMQTREIRPPEKAIDALRDAAKIKIGRGYSHIVRSDRDSAEAIHGHALRRPGVVPSIADDPPAGARPATRN